MHTYRMKKFMPVLLLAALPLFAATPPKKVPPKTKAKALLTIADNATFCDGTYALCIKAPCDPKANSNNEVQCACVMETGWNMGPNSCADRKKNLTSTYSNLFNPNSATVTCPSKINWAWCYGAPCEKVTKDGKEVANCRCPVTFNTAVILVDAAKCQTTDACSPTRMMSAASPKESSFANNHYYDWMTKHGHESSPPSPACPTQ
jgi:hypothetical protein